MTDAEIALELEHMAGVKHIAHQAVVLAQVKPPVGAGDDPRGILSAVLQHRQCIVDRLIDRRAADDTDDSAHGLTPRLRSGKL